MDIIYMNSENSKTSDPYTLLLNLSDEINLRKSNILSYISIYYTWRNIKKPYKNSRKLQLQLQRRKINLNYLMNKILHQIFKILLSISSKNIKYWLINSPIRIYVNKIENTITFKINDGYYLQILTPETMKLLASTKNNMSKDDKKVPHLEITEVVLINYNIVSNDYQHNLRVLYTFVNRLVNCLSHLKLLYF